MTVFFDALMIGIFGALGALSRTAINYGSRWYFGDAFAIGTLVVNVAGCFLIGLVLGSGLGQDHRRLNLAIASGFLGSLTTFSTFGLDTIEHMHGQEWHLGFLNIALNVVLGIAAVAAGHAIAKSVGSLTAS